MTPRIDCSKSPLAVRLSPEEAIALSLRDTEAMTQWRDYVLMSRQWVRPPLGERELYYCGAGKNGLFINPQGLMSLCNTSHVDTYDLRQGTLEEGWNVFLYEVRNKKRTRLTKCVNCGLSAGCSMCPAKGELESGDPEQSVDYLCQTTHLKAYVTGLDIPAHGDCECCPGGKYYESLQGSAQRLKSTKTSASRMLKGLPVLNQSKNAAALGCQSCH